MSRLIAIAYDLNFLLASEVYTGVIDAIKEAGLNWQLIPLNYGFEAQLTELADSGKLAGCIGSFVSDAWISRLTQKTVSAVNLFNFSKIESVSTVSFDDALMGQSAAQHLIVQGAKSVTFFARDKTYHSQLRESGLNSACPQNIFYQTDRIQSQEAQLECIFSLPKPAGVLCSSDRLARELILEMNRRRLKVGKDLLIMGIGNETAESVFAGVEISSFELPAKEVGYKAALILAEQLKDPNRLAPRQMLQLPAELIPRTSTLPKPQARLAQRAQQIAEARLADPGFDVNEMARALGVARRTLELALRQELHSSPYELISNIRMKMAKRLLANSQLPINEIGLCCGYEGPHHFSAWFKNRSGHSPRNYRAKHLA